MRNNNLFGRMERWFRQISHYFEYGDLVPFAVAVSAYHYSAALEKWGEFILIAICQGVLIDMLHFRSTRQAVRSKTFWAIIVAIITTLLSFSVHLLFYAYHPNDPQPWHLSFTVVMLAASLPVAIPVLAWLNDAPKDSKAVTAVKSALAAIKEQLQKAEDALKASEARLQANEDQLKTNEARLQANEEALNSTEAKLKETEAELKAMRATLKHLGPLGQDIVFNLLPGKMTGTAVAEKHGISEGTVSGIKAKMNGGGK